MRRRRWPPLEDGNTGSHKSEVDGSRATRTGPLEVLEGGVAPPKRTGDRASILSPEGDSFERASARTLRTPER